LRLFLHAGAYWIMWGLRVAMPKKSMWRVAQFDTLRLRLIKIAARVVEMKTMIRVHLRHRVRGNRFYADLIITGGRPACGVKEVCGLAGRVRRPGRSAPPVT
jgi:hypothetical protein